MAAYRYGGSIKASAGISISGETQRRRRAAASIVKHQVAGGGRGGRTAKASAWRM